MKTKFTALESELHVSKLVNDNLTKYIKTLERKWYENEQYSRSSVCRYYIFLWSKCKKLYLNTVVESFWVSKGSYRIRLHDKSVKVITHFDDLKTLFPENPVLEENSGSS